MNSEWRVLTIDEIRAPVKGSIAIGPFGSRMKSDCYVDDGVRVVRGTNISSGRTFAGDFVFITAEKADELGNANLLPGDLVFPHRGSIGEVGVVPDDGRKYVISSSMMKLTCDESKALPLFVYYFFKSELGKFELLKNSSQVGTPGIGQPLASLKSIKTLFPTLPVQFEIVEMLGAIDDRIALLRKTNTTLEAIAQALFKSWFVDFDPVRAKLEGRILEGMDEATAALFPENFEESESELALIPTGWRVGTLQDLATLNPESWTLKAHPDAIQYIDLANTKNNNISETELFQFGDAPSRARRVLRAGDSIIGTVRPGNRSFAYIYSGANNLTGSTGFAVLRPINQKNAEFIFIAATQNSSIDHLAHVADGGAYPAVRPEVVAGIKVVLPSDAVTDAFHKIVFPIFSLVGENKIQAQTLVSLRDTLLPRLISGQLRLPEAETILEKAIA